jgi:hypothetical protein
MRSHFSHWDFCAKVQRIGGRHDRKTRTSLGNPNSSTTMQTAEYARDEYFSDGVSPNPAFETGAVQRCALHGAAQRDR